MASKNENIDVALPDADPDLPALAPEQYQRIVALPLQAAAELAAARGDRNLINDMAAMLALRTLVGYFGQFYLAAHPDATATTRTAIARAPEGACAMPFKRSELDEIQVKDCLWALAAASKQLFEAGVMGPEAASARAAWDQFRAGDRDTALKTLKRAAVESIVAIERFERVRSGGPAEDPAADKPH